MFIGFGVFRTGKRAEDDALGIILQPNSDNSDGNQHSDGNQREELHNGIVMQIQRGNGLPCRALLVWKVELRIDDCRPLVGGA